MRSQLRAGIVFCTASLLCCKEDVQYCPIRLLPQILTELRGDPAFWLMLLPKHVTTDGHLLSSTDLQKIYNILVHVQKYTSFFQRFCLLCSRLQKAPALHLQSSRCPGGRPDNCTPLPPPPPPYNLNSVQHVLSICSSNLQSSQVVLFVFIMNIYSRSSAVYVVIQGLNRLKNSLFL